MVCSHRLVLLAVLVYNIPIFDTSHSYIYHVNVGHGCPYSHFGRFVIMSRGR